MLDQEDEDLFWQDKVETGLGCLKVGNKLSVHKSLQIFNSWQRTISFLIFNDSTKILKDAIREDIKYYFADFVRKRGTPHPLRTKF